MKKTLQWTAILAVIAVSAGVLASTAAATVFQVYFVGDEDVNALTGQFSSTICSGCLVRAYLQKSDGTKPCDGTAYGYVYCSLAVGVTANSRAHCVNPSTSSSRWFQCWKWRS